MSLGRDRELYFAITGLEDPSAQQAAEPPTLLELADRIAARGAYTGPSSAQIIRADRDAR